MTKFSAFGTWKFDSAGFDGRFVGLVLDRDGFPKAHEVFEGNVQDRSTVTFPNGLSIDAK